MFWYISKSTAELVRFILTYFSCMPVTRVQYLFPVPFILRQDLHTMKCTNLKCIFSSVLTSTNTSVTKTPASVENSTVTLGSSPMPLPSQSPSPSRGDDGSHVFPSVCSKISCKWNHAVCTLCWRHLGTFWGLVCVVACIIGLLLFISENCPSLWIHSRS